ncbi:hypothetical protein CHS0354_040566 [Potamilus streckersoni]|uniref:Uncharacterized protein n=1 Tax=Potamilus streckersoni TaxID=2493646 RepID=A0AAE0VUZ2_9BIVA|nr:hypothetical protein CHS0354_040566 [Potamilus streckersoni]
MAATNPGDSQRREEPHCPICLVKFKTPRQLPCLHSFCQGCLEDFISSKAVKMKELKQFECPICRTMVPVSKKGKTPFLLASLFPINTILQSIGDKEKEEVDKHCDCCLSDGISVTANGFCVVCDEAMCENCLNVHKKQQATKDHSIVTIEELANNPTHSIRYHKGFRCQEHEEEDLKFYCRDHKIACCASCCVLNHRNCDQVLDLKKDANSLILEIKPLKVLDEMKILEDHLMNFDKRNDSYIISLKSQVQEMTNKIKDIRKKLYDLLDDLECKVKTEGNQRYKEEAIRKQEENRECQALLNAVRNSHMTLEMVMKHGSDTQHYSLTINGREGTVKKQYCSVGPLADVYGCRVDEL